MRTWPCLESLEEKEGCLETLIYFYFVSKQIHKQNYENVIKLSKRNFSVATHNEIQLWRIERIREKNRKKCV